MIDDDDPFAQPESDRTVLKPTPGGRRGSAAQPPRAAVPSQSAQGSGGGAPRLHVPGLNPLVDAAGALLQLGGQLRNTSRHADPSGLCYHVASEIKQFEARARETGASPEQVLAARYTLCTFLDEIVLSTPWGVDSEWAQNTLLTQFHQEAWGGEKFFSILERLMQNPAANIDLLEMMYLMLSLGFEGRYKIQNRGQETLEQIQNDLHRAIRQIRGEHEPELAPHWQGIGDLRNPLSRFVPLWVVAAVGLAVMLTVFFGLRLALSNDSQPAHDSLMQVGRDTTPLITREGQPRLAANLETFLAAEKQAGLVDVVDQPGRSTVTVLGRVYRSGSANIDPPINAVLQRIAEALNSVSGRINVIGHTDSDRIPAGLRLKFASNWELSEQRANSVRAALIDAGVSDHRIAAEGMADSVPLVENNSPANKALNRRVEIVLVPSGSGY